jgi:hypothetical protein
LVFSIRIFLSSNSAFLLSYSLIANHFVILSCCFFSANYFFGSKVLPPILLGHHHFHRFSPSIFIDCPFS